MLRSMKGYLTAYPLMPFIVAFYLPQVFLFGYLLYPGQALLERGIPCVLLMLLCSLLYGWLEIAAYLKYLAIQLGAALLFATVWAPFMEIALYAVAPLTLLLPFVLVMRERRPLLDFSLMLFWPVCYPFFFVSSWLSTLRGSILPPQSKPWLAFLLHFGCYLLLTLLPYSLGRLAKRKFSPL